MTINIWIRRDDLEDLSYFISDDFAWDKEMKIDVCYAFPAGTMIHQANDFLNVSLSYKEYKKLEDL